MTASRAIMTAGHYTSRLFPLRENRIGSGFIALSDPTFLRVSRICMILAPIAQRCFSMPGQPCSVRRLTAYDRTVGPFPAFPEGTGLGLYGCGGGGRDNSIELGFLLIPPPLSMLSVIGRMLPFDCGGFEPVFIVGVSLISDCQVLS